MNVAPILSLLGFVYCTNKKTKILELPGISFLKYRLPGNFEINISEIIEPRQISYGGGFHIIMSSRLNTMINWDNEL